MFERGLKNKKGVSAVVATVLIVLITFAAVGIVWITIVPILKEGFSSCEDSGISIVSQGYTCYDSVNGLVAVQVKKSPTEFAVEKLDFLIYSGGDSYKIPVDVNFSASENSFKSFNLDVSAVSSVDKISVVPYIFGGKVCGEVSVSNLLPCDLSDVNKSKGSRDISGILSSGGDDTETPAGDGGTTIPGETIGACNSLEGAESCASNSSCEWVSNLTCVSGGYSNISVMCDSFYGLNNNFTNDLEDCTNDPFCIWVENTSCSGDLASYCSEFSNEFCPPACQPGSGGGCSPSSGCQLFDKDACIGSGGCTWNDFSICTKNSSVLECSQRDGSSCLEGKDYTRDSFPCSLVDNGSCVVKPGEI